MTDQLPPPPPPEWNRPPTGPPTPPYGTGGYGYGAPNPKNRSPWLIPSLIAAAIALVVIIVVVVLIVNRGGTPGPVVTAAPPVVTTAPAAPVTTPPVTETTPPVTTTTEPGDDGSVPGSPRAGANEDNFAAALLLTDSKGVNHGDYWGGKDKTTVLKLGYAICSAYDDGTTTQKIVDVMVSKGIPFTEANWVRAAAVVTLCPEYKTP